MKFNVEINLAIKMLKKLTFDKFYNNYLLLINISELTFIPHLAGSINFGTR